MGVESLILEEGTVRIVTTIIAITIAIMKI